MPHTIQEQWNPETILSIYNAEKNNSITCVGYAPSCRRRCQNPINFGNRQLANSILQQLAITSPQASGQKANLRALAECLLCQRYHQNQASDMVRKWQLLMMDYTLKTVTSAVIPSTQLPSQYVKMTKKAYDEFLGQTQSIYELRQEVQVLRKQLAAEQKNHAETKQEKASNDSRHRFTTKQLKEDLAEEKRKQQVLQEDLEIARDIARLQVFFDESAVMGSDCDESEDSLQDKKISVLEISEIVLDTAVVQDVVLSEDLDTTLIGDIDIDSKVEEQTSHVNPPKTYAHSNPTKHSRWTDSRRPEMLPMYTICLALACVFVLDAVA